MMPAAVVIASVAAITILPHVLAQAPTPQRLTGSVTLVGDYRFRGVSQTYAQPAIQGGAEYAFPAGAYAGSWASNVSGNQFLNGGSLELDLYGGYRWTAGNRGLDVGVYFYCYPPRITTLVPAIATTQRSCTSAHYQQFSAKYSHAVTNLFGMKTSTVGGFCGITSDGTAGSTNCLGTGSSKGSYVDLAASFDIVARMNLQTHYGYQYVRDYPQLSYADYRLALTRQFGGVTLGAAAVDTDAQRRFYRYTPTTAGSQETGRRQAGRRSLGKQSILRSCS